MVVRELELPRNVQGAVPPFVVSTSLTSGRTVGPGEVPCLLGATTAAGAHDDRAESRRSPSRWWGPSLRGALHGADVSFFLVESGPGQGPALHSHPYAEVFVVRSGRVRFTVGGTTLEAAGGDIVVAPPETAHRFVNAGRGPLEMLAIHAAGSMLTRWFPELSDT